MLDYGSFNLIENLGSISIFIALNLIWVMVASLIMVSGRYVACKLRYKWMMKVREKFRMTHVIQGQFRFVSEIFFDLFQPFEIF